MGGRGSQLEEQTGRRGVWGGGQIGVIEEVSKARSTARELVS